jgi:O-antigen ligase
MIIIFSTNLFTIGALTRSAIKDYTDISPIAITRQGTVIFVSALFLYLYDRTIKNKTILIMILIISGAMIMLGMSRGPLISVFLAFLIYTFVNEDKAFSNFFKILIIGGIIILFAILIMQYYMPEVINTFVDRFYELEDYESSLRYKRYLLFFSNYFDIISISSYDFIFGTGPDGFNRIFRIGYAHNFFVESVFEYGLLGFIFILLFTFNSFKSAFFTLKSESSQQNLFIPLLFFFLFISSMFGGDLLARRNLFFIAIIQLSFTFLLKQKRIE